MKKHSVAFREALKASGESVAVSCVASCGKNGSNSTVFIGDNFGNIHFVEFAVDGKVETKLRRLCEVSGCTFNVANISNRAVVQSAIETLCTSAQGDSLCIGTDSTVYLEDADVDDLRLQNSIVRRTLPTSCCVMDASNRFLFIGSQEPNLQVVDLSSRKVLLSVPTNDTGIRSVATGMERYVCCVDNSGNVLILELLASNQSVVSFNVCHEAKGVADVSHVRNPSMSFKMDFMTKHAAVVLPSRGGSVICFYKDSTSADWKEMYLSTHDGEDKHVEGPAIITVYSSKLNLLATGDTSGKVIIWKVASTPDDGPSFSYASTVKVNLEFQEQIVDVAWLSEALVITTSFKCETFHEFHTLPADRTQSVAVENSTSAGPTSRLKKKAVQPADSGKEDDDWLADNLESIDGIRKTVVTKAITASPGGTDEDSEDDEDLDAESQSDKPVTAEIVPHPGFRSKPTYHPSVQIASTKPDEKGRRYLVWNSVGNVTCKTEDISNRIEVRFANKSKRSKQEIVNDSWGFVMAALAHEGAVFATPLPLQENDEPTTGSTIRYHAFSTGSERLFGANESFTVSLENNEAAVSLAVGTGWVAVATSRRFLRIFSCTGCQLGVHWLQGNVVCLCGYENLLAVVYNTMPMTGDEYHVSVDLFDVTPNISDFVRCVSTTVLPLSPGHQLNWMGFSVDSLQLFAEDTSGVFSMLTALGPGSNSWRWVPSLEIEKFKKSAGHKYWPVTIMENKLAYVLLSGENKPAIYPEPVITTQPLRIPLCEPREGREKTDEACDRIHQLMYRSYQISHCHYLEWELRSTDRSHDGRQLETIVASQDVHASELDKAVLKQFQEACRTQRIAVAIDLALKMRTQKALTLGLTIADHFGRSHVAQKIQDIISLRSHHMAEDEGNYGISNTPDEEVVGPPISAAPRLHSSGNGNLGDLSNENFSQQTHKKPAINPFGKAQQPPSQLKRVQASDLTDLQSPAKKPSLSVSKLAQLLDRQYDIKFCFAGSVNRPFLKKHARTSLLEELCCKILTVVKLRRYIESTTRNIIGATNFYFSILVT
jgi:hypothetical protein